MALRYRVLLAVVTAVPLALATACSGGGNAERGLRFGLERSHRAQALLAADQRRRIELVDEANHVRPGTWS